MKIKNMTTILKSVKDADHPYTVVSNNWNDYKKLNGYERAIMLELMSNDPNTFIINKNVIEKRLGFPHKKFNDAWKSLEEKYFIFCDRKKMKQGVHWIIRESESISQEQPQVRIPKKVLGCNYMGDQLIINNIISTNKTTLEPEDLSLKGEGEDKDLIGKQTNRSNEQARLSPLFKSDLNIDNNEVNVIKLKPVVKFDVGLTLNEDESLINYEMDLDEIPLKTKPIVIEKFKKSKNSLL